MKNLILFCLVPLCLASISAFAQSGTKGLTYALTVAPICDCSTATGKAEVSGTSMKPVSNAGPVWALLDEAKAACKLEAIAKTYPKAKYSGCGLKYVRVFP